VDYAWSSYANYAGKAGFIYTDLALSLLEGQFEFYMNNNERTQCLDMSGTTMRMTDMELSAVIEEMLNIPAPIIATLERGARDTAIRRIPKINGSAYRQISRVTGCSLGTISRAANS